MAFQNRPGQREKLRPSRQPKHGKNVAFFDLIATEADELVERRFGIPQRAFGSPGGIEKAGEAELAQAAGKALAARLRAYLEGRAPAKAAETAAPFPEPAVPEPAPGMPAAQGPASQESAPAATE